MSLKESLPKPIAQDAIAVVTALREQIVPGLLSHQQAHLLLEIAQEQNWPFRPLDVELMMALRGPYYSGELLLGFFPNLQGIKADSWYEITQLPPTLEEATSVVIGLSAQERVCIREIPPLEIVIFLSEAYKLLFPIDESQILPEDNPDLEGTSSQAQ
jgi:hypothetical protein